MTDSEHRRCPVVLIVEDEILVRMAQAGFLRDEGYQVLEAGDAVQAMAFIRTNVAIDLVVTDVRMPGKMNGLALAREIRIAQPNLPIVVMSGHLPEDEARIADRFLQKPFSSEQLAGLAKELIDRKWQSRRGNSKAS